MAEAPNPDRIRRAIAQRLSLRRPQEESLAILADIAAMMGASAGFITPIGYQTNLMVYGPGGYRFTDYVRLGLPLSLVVGTAVLLAIPWFWPF